MTARAAEVVTVTAVAALLTMVIAIPVLRAPSERVFGRETVGRHHDPFTVMQQFGRPIAETASTIYSQPLTDIPGALLARAAGPVAAYNWLVLLTFPLSAAAAFMLGRYLGLSFPGAAMAAIAFAFSPFHLAQAAYHPHIAQTQWMPLYFFALWRCLDDSSPTAVALLAVSVCGVTLSNFYGGFIAAVMTPAALAAYRMFSSRTSERRPRASHHLRITVRSLLVLACLGVWYGWFVARAILIDGPAFEFTRADLFRYSAKWWSYLLPPAQNPWLGAMTERIWNAAGVQDGLLEQQITLGSGLVALSAVAVFAWATASRTNRFPGAIPALAIVGAVAVVCSLAPERSVGPFTVIAPSAVLYQVAPMFRSYARFGLIVQLMTALLAAFGAQHLWRSKHRLARPVCAALLTLAAAEYAIWPPALARDVLPTNAHRWVVRQADTARVLDCAPFTPESQSVEWLSANRISLIRSGFADCMEPNFVGRLAAAGYTHLLVRNNSAEERWFSNHPPLEGLRVAARFDDGQVFAVTGAPPWVYTDRMTAFYPREHDERWTWRWMGRDASWKVVNSRDRPVVAALDVELTAFQGARRLTLSLDGAPLQSLIVEEGARIVRIGPLALDPGVHDLVFHPDETPAVADDYLDNGDRRALSFAVGAWSWTIENELR